MAAAALAVSRMRDASCRDGRRARTAAGARLDPRCPTRSTTRRRSAKPSEHPSTLRCERPKARRSWTNPSWLDHAKGSTRPRASSASRSVTRFVNGTSLPFSSTTRRCRWTTIAPRLRCESLPSATRIFSSSATKTPATTSPGLYSLVATREANDINPLEYRRDVMLRISTHPADRNDELLPDRWNPAESA
jgi:hypothetical protein